MPDAPLLALNDVTLEFGGLTAVERLSLDIARGSRTALIGPNGAGKTTVFNLISGVYRPTAGTICLDGTDISNLPSRERIRFGIARNFQNIRLISHLSVIENVMIGQHCRVRGFLNAIRPVSMTFGNRWKLDARAALERAGLGQYENVPVGGLPYGVQKRIEIVRALQASPKLFLLDEPAAGLNLAEKADLAVLIKTIVCEEGITLLVVEHDMQFIDSICEHIVVLNFGRKIAEGTGEDVRDNPVVQEAYLGTPPRPHEDAARHAS